MLATMSFTMLKGASPGFGNAPLFVLRHRLHRIRSGYPPAGSGRSSAPSPALSACVWPEICRLSHAATGASGLGFLVGEDNGGLGFVTGVVTPDGVTRWGQSS